MSQPLQLGKPAPDFCADTTQGQICLKDLRGKWVLFFSHPGDFTPICTTEFVEFAKRFPDFSKRGVFLIGLSIDTVFSHISWTRNIREKFGIDIPFPIIGDPEGKVARLFGMIPEGKRETVRAVLLIDPDGNIAWMAYYPYTNGRNIDEIIRVIDAIQTTYKYGVSTPANWRPGDPVVVPAPKTKEEVDARLKDSSVECKDWYICFKKLEIK
ncbi:MAG: peroxiredoxin [Thermocladium sp.]|jgi:peroxiredoxin (alkyl hydroperoxide reductase subunit C)|nr:MAG: peroxiredoxin [Thermocladium sp. ECH_B]